MENKKYELVKDDSIVIDGKTLYRIKALRDFGNVKAGDIGGYVSEEHNLSHNGNCWIYDDAKVYGWANIRNDAQVYSNAKVYGWANIRDGAKICDNAIVYGNATICDNTKVVGDAELCDYVELHEDAYISSDKDYLYIKGLGSANRSATAFKQSDGSIYVIYGGFGGTLDEFETMLKDAHGNSKYYKRFMPHINEMRNHFNIS